MKDETMSQDIAFSTDNAEGETFTFDEDKETSPESLPKEENVDTDSASDEDKTPDVEQRVPYSRFKKVVEERDEITNRIKDLEDTLIELQNNRRESTPEDVEMPKEWTELYGDNDVAKRAWIVQQRREEEIQERAIEEAIKRIQDRQIEEVEAIAENEETIDEHLEELQASIGRKLTAKQEEEILTIVDEFSPTGRDGKYITLFPFEKAWEIYSLRQSQKGLGTRQARQSVVDLTNNTSEGDADSEAPFRRGWDNWRNAI